MTDATRFVVSGRDPGVFGHVSVSAVMAAVTGTGAAGDARPRNRTHEIVASII